MSYAEAGVVGWVSSDAGGDDLIGVVDAVRKDGACCSHRAAASLMKRLCDRAKTESAFRGLTQRELQILELLACGLSNRDVAGHLSIEIGTVKNHVHNILKKVGAESRADAAQLWRVADNRAAVTAEDSLPQ